MKDTDAEKARNDDHCSSKQLAPRIYQLDLQGELVKEMTRPDSLCISRFRVQIYFCGDRLASTKLIIRNETCRLIYRVEGAERKCLPP